MLRVTCVPKITLTQWSIWCLFYWYKHLMLHTKMPAAINLLWFIYFLWSHHELYYVNHALYHRGRFGFNQMEVIFCTESCIIVEWCWLYRSCHLKCNKGYGALRHYDGYLPQSFILSKWENKQGQVYIVFCRNYSKQIPIMHPPGFCICYI